MSSQADGLPETLRQQYLSAMGIQPWYDPSIELSSTGDSSLETRQDIAAKNIHNENGVVDEPIDNQSIVSVAQAKVESAKVESATVEQKKTSPISTKTSTDILGINTAIMQCELCELHTFRKQAICGEGNDQADLLIIINAPVGENEAALLSPADKKMLQAMLSAINIDLSAVYITSLVKCKPPELRTPSTSEVICCDEHLSAQIKLIQPKVIFILGEQASQQLLVSQKSLIDLRLRHHQHMGVPVYASYHPHECLNSAQIKRKVWQDLLQISKHIF